MRGIYFILGCMLLSGCLDSDLSTTDVSKDNDVTYLGIGELVSDYENDDYRIIGITPDRNRWSIILEYSGGCEKHEFYVLWNGEWQESDPPQTSFTIIHNSNGDACEALVRDTLTLQLDRVLNLVNPEAIITVVNASNNREIVIDSYLADLSENDDCDLEATLFGTSCGLGLWENQWFLLKDSVGPHPRVWLQPVANSLSVDLKLPTNGIYIVGVTPLFGYQYTDDKVHCLSIPEGSIVPVALNCVEEK